MSKKALFCPVYGKNNNLKFFMKTVAIIQARMGSTRLPGKVLMDLAGQPALNYVVERTLLAKTLNAVWLATTKDKSDDALANFAKKLNLKFYRGSVEDVLDRYYQAAKLAKADIIVRITGDCPLIDYKLIDEAVRFLKKGNYDFVTNCVPPTLPDGLDVEAVTFGTLKKVWQEAKWASEREHPFSYIVRNPELFRIGKIIKKKDFSAFRITLDYPADLEYLDLVIKECQKKKKYCGEKEIISILLKHPDWIKLNKRQIRNENYWQSLKEDKIVKHADA